MCERSWVKFEGHIKTEGIFVGEVRELPNPQGQKKPDEVRIPNEVAPILKPVVDVD